MINKIFRNYFDVKN